MCKVCIKFTLIIVIVSMFFNCKSQKDMIVKTENERVVDLFFFSDEKDTIQKNIYPLKQEYIEDKAFVLKNNNTIFFRGDYNHNDYLFEGIQGKFFFITPIDKPNNYASPFLAKRDSVFLYDIENNKLYNFNAKLYLIKAYKKRPPESTESIKRQKDKGYQIKATYHSVNIENNELFLLLEDLVTIERVKLKPKTLPR